jgi:hypothetical protein
MQVYAKRSCKKCYGRGITGSAVRIGGIECRHEHYCKCLKFEKKKGYDFAFSIDADEEVSKTVNET